ncbi:hypothetical protein [Streptomyces sp. NBC_00094]|uniref:hypothetical protein n=1 Tax=Streptomyces sp. NBC_00094 TaxID=2903620 RepID=UPI002257E788|nr:hypothetical protein [Streptomyces sp. NBC_00094]MCX5390423.1 hypothetical protein [Streptomyces sp. NBC_00094]
MSSEEPRQGWPTAPAYPPSGPAYGGGYGTPAPPAPARGASHRGAWIGAGATLVAAVIGVVGTYLVSSGKNANTVPPTAQGPAPSSQGSDDAPKDASPGQESAPGRESTPDQESTPGQDSSQSPESQATESATATAPAKPADTVVWQGALAITYTEDKDLDSAPPVESEIAEENDFSVYPFGTTHMLRPEGATKALVWKESTRTPTYEDCAGVVDTLGTSTDMKLKTGLVACARTNDGRLARLTVKELTGQGSDTSGVFDVVVWSR